MRVALASKLSAAGLRSAVPKMRSFVSSGTGSQAMKPPARWQLGREGFRAKSEDGWRLVRQAPHVRQHLSGVRETKRSVALAARLRAGSRYLLGHEELAARITGTYRHGDTP